MRGHVHVFSRDRGFLQRAEVAWDGSGNGNEVDEKLDSFSSSWQVLRKRFKTERGVRRVLQ